MERLNESPQPAETDMVQQFRPVVSDIQKYVNDKTMVLGLKIDIIGPYRNMLISVTRAFSNLPKIMEGVSRFLMNIGFFFILLFFLIRYGRELAAYFRSLLPVEPERIDVFFNKFREITYASILSSGVIALTQGLLGLFIYLSLGVEEAFFWAVLTALCSFVPIIGSAGAWLSVTVLLLISGSYLKAVIMFVLGVFVISLSDDILRPLLIKGKNNIHPVLLFFSIICGIMTMGFIGIFAGPLIMVIVMTALEMYRVNLSVSNRPGVTPDKGNGNSGVPGS